MQPKSNLTSQPIPDWKLQLSYFYVNHQIVIKRLLIFLLFFTDVIVIFLFATTLINYQTGIISDQKYLEQLPLNLINHQIIDRNFKPEEIIISEVTAVRADNNLYDLLVIIDNPNSDWMIRELKYSFDINGQSLEPRTSFILPNSRKPIMYFNVQNGRQAQLKLLNLNWVRVYDYSLISYQDGVKITNSSFTHSYSTNNYGQLKITVDNQTPFSFWEVGLPIILYGKSANIIGLNYITLKNLLFQEQRQIQINWPGQISDAVLRIEIHPEINLTNENSIMELDSSPGSPPGRD